jgi:hypothetical protein
MAEPFSTNELFLRSDRIAFGKIPPEVSERTEQTLILPDLTGTKLYFGLSSLVSTSGLTGTLEAIYPQFASFTFDNLNNRLGINVSSPQYALDISTTSGVRILGGTLIANAQGLVSVPTAALFSTLPTYVFAPGTIPPTAIASTGQTIPGLSVPTSALFSTLPTALFAPSSIPLLALQSSGIIVASSFVGDGFYLSNIPLANINGSITGDFFRPNSIPLSTLASTGQIWIREPTGSIFAPIMSTGQFFASSIQANSISSIRLQTAELFASTIRATTFESGLFSASNLSAINIKASSIQILKMVSTARFFGDGRSITNLTPSYLNDVIPADKFGYRLIAFDALNPYGTFQVIAGQALFYQDVPVTVQGTITASTFQGGYFRGDGGGLYNINSISTAALTSTVAGLGTAGYVSTTQLTSTVRTQGNQLRSTVEGLASSRYISSTQLISSLEGLATLGYLSTTQLTSSIEGLGSANYISSTQLQSTVEGLLLTLYDDIEVKSTLEGLGTYGYVSTLSLTSSLEGLGSLSYISSASLTSSLRGLGSMSYVSTLSLISSLEGLGTLNYVSTASLVSTTDFFRRAGFLSTPNLQSTVEGLGSALYVSSSQLASTVEGLGSAFYISTLSLNSTVEGLGSALYVSSSQLASTVTGLGTSGYISSLSLTSSIVSTTQGLQEYISSFIDPTELASTILSTVSGLALGSNLASTVQGLGTAGYVSTLSLVSTTQGLQEYISSFIDPAELTSSITSTVSGLALGSNLASTVRGLGTAGYVSTLSLVSTTQGLQEYVSSFIDTTELASTILSTVSGLALGSNLASTVRGLGTAGYVSTLSLVSTTQGLQEYVSSFIDTTELASTILSTVSGLALGSNLASTVQGLGTAGYVSTLSLVSTTQGLQAYVSSFIDPTELTSSITSTVIGIGIGPNLASTVQGLGTAGYVSTLSLTSSVQEAISSLSTAYGFLGRLTSIPSSLSTFAFFTSSIQASTITSRTVSTLDLWVSSINGALPGSGGLATIPSTLSTFAIFTSSLTTSTLNLGGASSMNVLKYYGLQGNYNNTVLAEISTGVGIQELLLFKGSSASDRVRVQTTGNFVVETGVSARLWNDNTTGTLSNVTPAFIINTSSNVGIQTASPGATLDVVGTGRFQILSSLAMFGSSLVTSVISTQRITVRSTLTVIGQSVSAPSFLVNMSSQIGLNVSTPLAQFYIKDLAGTSSNPPISIFDKDPTSVVTSNQQYSGVYVFYTVPSAVTSITFNLWGAGGGSIGGGGAFVQAVVPTTPGEQLRFIIGLAGNTTSLDPTDAQGGAGSNPASGFDGRGGGRTAVQKFISGQWVEVLTAGGGGGGTSAFGGFGGGNARWIGTSDPGQTAFGSPGGGGGTQSSGGGAGTDGGAGSFQKGGFGRFLGGSGGGGYFGGGGGYTGGGGASFVLSTLGGVPLTTNYTGINGNGGTAIATTYFGYIAGVGVTGGNGLIALQYNGFRESDYIDFNRGGTTVFSVNSLGGVAVSKAAVSQGYALDVAGNIAGTQATLTVASTQSLLVSSINGQSFGGPLFSSIVGLGSAGYVSTLSLVSTTQGLQTFISSFIDPTELASTVTAITSNQLISTFGLNTALTSTVAGLGTAGYVSTLTLTSTVNAAISSLSTAYGIVGSLASIPSTVSTFNVLTSSLTASTIQTTYFSSLAIWVCTINGAPPGSGSGGLANIPSTLSTFAIFTSSLVASTIQSIQVSSQILLTSTLITNALAASTGVISSFSTNIINFAGGFGYLTMPDIYPNTVFTSSVTSSNLQVGWNSVISPIQFYGFGSYLNSVVAELSTGGTTQELIMFRGSNASDRIRMQTTGSIVFEPGVSARLWPTVPSNVTPAMVINTSSNVGIQVAAPTVALDVGGQMRAIGVSTQQIATSSILNNPRIVGAVITSSFSMLGPSTFLVGAFSTSFMTAGTPEIDFYTNNVMRMTILSNGNVGIGTAGPTVLLDVNGAGRFTTLSISSMTALNSISTMQFQMSSVTGDNVQVNTLSSIAMGASTFTGKWNDAQYYVLQTI